MQRMKTSRRQFVQAAAADCDRTVSDLGRQRPHQRRHCRTGRPRHRSHQYYSSLDADCRIAAVCDVNQAARERAVANVKKKSGQTRKNTRTCARCSSPRTSTQSRLPLRITGTRWRPSGPARRAKMCTWRSRPATTFLRAAADGGGRAQVQPHGAGGFAEPLDAAQDASAIQLLHEGVIGQVYHARGALLPPALLDRPHAG